MAPFGNQNHNSVKNITLNASISRKTWPSVNENIAAIF